MKNELLMPVKSQESRVILKDLAHLLIKSMVRMSFRVAAIILFSICKAQVGILGKGLTFSQV